MKIYVLLFMAFLMVSCKSITKAENNIEKPNIVFIYTDDQTYETIRALGNSEIQTPNMDKLVNEGTTFTTAFNMGGWGGAVCVASRAMMMSGAHVWRAKAQEDLWMKNDSVAINRTWAKLMSKNGYNTYMTGKWHVKIKANSVFDTVAHVRGGMPQYARKYREGTEKKKEIYKLGYNRPLNKKDTLWSPTDPKFEGFWKGGKHWSEVVKDDALSFISDASKKEAPFFMYLAFNAPHDPRQAPQEFLDMYPLDNIAVPESFLPEYPYKDSIGNGSTLRDEALAPFPRTPYAVKKHRQEYYALITHLDQQIGEILIGLEASGKKDNTYIFFTSDHGLAVGQHGLIGKQSLFDHSMRVPLMVVGPDIPKGKRLDQEVYLQDIMATSLEIAGIEKPSYVEYHSLLDFIKDDKKQSNYDAIYGCYREHQRMIRKDGYKLLVYPKIEKILLFDLTKDPEEITDLAENPEQSERVKVLFKELLKLQNDMDDSLDLTGLYNKLTT
ncbi:sulfatase-like hydrolase/transferase [Tamlana sp. 2201CG12-4]|uniref:sulfatase-like hydrolase/transferase n=1 Tax=Tamlana sp. 2201CG12-4 TaxID=3112582 RepID=UPI002DBAC3A0|nr:sulfatase-like hydrolase/transferase [Tamlana sp. 2201CG12-4]MEC3907223.1 sulfatase-like hydrolase/transferase [Tamlana sp. 2201CG12-4]